MKKKKIIFSFDYELFFGECSGTVRKTLIEPTNLLLDTMDSMGAKGNFFVDYLMFERLEQLDDERAKEDLKLVKDQVKGIVRRGHRIELHLHPHWIDAKYNGDGTWDYSDFTHYSLYSLSKEEISRQFREGIAYLTNLAREVDSDYRVCAFRAGGWTIQPFEIVKECFKENGIVIDSSVMHGAYMENQYSKYDFQNAPNKEFYRFSDDVCVEDMKGEFVEVILYLLTPKKKCITDGTHFRADLPVVKRYKKWMKLEFMSFSMSNRIPLYAYFLFLMSNKSLITVIDHPKDFKENALTIIKLYMKRATSTTYYELLKNEM